MLYLSYGLALAAIFTLPADGSPINDISLDNPPHSGTACPQDSTISVTVNSVSTTRDKYALLEKLPRTCQP
jgi:hypothetical protein